LAKLVDHWRTTTFRLSLLYCSVFVLVVVALLGVIYWRTAGEMTRQTDEVIEFEIGAFRKLTRPDLETRIAFEMARDVRLINVYGLFDERGSHIAGNLLALPQHLPEDGTLHGLRDARLKGRESALQQLRVAAVQLDSGDLLVVGRDVALLNEIRTTIVRVLIGVGALALIAGIGAGLVLSLSPLRRIRAIKSASDRVVEGDVRARLPIAGRHDELDMLAGIVNAMLDEVERLVKEVKSVCDSVAHDLRTPLTRLRAKVYRMQQDLREQPRHRDAAEQAVAEIDTLLGRFNALLRISEIEDRARRDGFAEVDLAAIIQQTLELYEPLADERGVRIAYLPRVVPHIYGDGELLFEALNNLVDNAIKFTPAEGTVVVALVDAPDGPRIDIIDTGPGIPAEERETVLQRFYRGESARDLPGSGLGLSIVSAIVRVHRFTLEIADAPSGTRVSLHCRDAQAPA
jgi:signal transduction histidine kinase